MASNFMSNITHVWNSIGHRPIEETLNKLSHDKIIQIVDRVHNVSKDNKHLDPPILCAVGGQSSGKSATLNNIMNLLDVDLDILPSGSGTVTRTPIKIKSNRVPDAKEHIIEFFGDDNGANEQKLEQNEQPYNIDENQKLLSKFTIPLGGQPGMDYSSQIQNEIMRLTDMYAGASKNIVDRPINIKISSPNVQNLFFIDLPGAMTMPLIDKGQAADIDVQTDAMIQKYIQRPNAKILAIIPANADIQTDLGLKLIKKCNPTFDRVVICFTKVDTLPTYAVNGSSAQSTHSIVECLNPNSTSVSASIRPKHGFYAVKNKLPGEKDSRAIEQKFFNDTEPFKSCQFKNRMGSNNLGNGLADIFIEHAKERLPKVMCDIDEIDRSIDLQLNAIGRDYPVTDSDKRLTLNSLVHAFQCEYDDSINENGASHGATIGESLELFTTNMSKLEPFSQNNVPDNVIYKMIRDYNGFKMPDATISSKIIEKCVKGIYIDVNTNINNKGINEEKNVDVIIPKKKYEPIKIMKEPFLQCLNEIQKIMLGLVDDILKTEKFRRFPNLCQKIRDIIASHIITNRYSLTQLRVDDLIDEETNCVWTQNKRFRNEILPTMYTRSKDGLIEPGVIRNVLSGYFDVIRDVSIHSIHKKIVVFFINGVVTEISTNLPNILYNKSDLSTILEERKNEAEKRAQLIKTKSEIDSIKKMFNSI